MLAWSGGGEGGSSRGGGCEDGGGASGGEGGGRCWEAEEEPGSLLAMGRLPVLAETGVAARWRALYRSERLEGPRAAWLAEEEAALRLEV